MKFELVELGKDGETAVLVFHCRHEIHKKYMTLDEARMRGIEGSWKDGYVWEKCIATISNFRVRTEIPRIKKKAQVIKYEGTFLRCNDCGYSERVYFSSKGDAIVDVLKLLN